MKKILLTITMLIAVIALFFALGTSASAETYGDLTYYESGGEITITGCDTSVTTVEIPSEIDGYPVTTIGDYAFAYCDSLASITIGDSVTTIVACAFFHCDSLASVTIGDSVTTIGDYAFSDCDSLASIEIPDSVTTIGDYAFAFCYDLTNIIIPDSVTTIGDGAFSCCFSLESIKIPDSVTTIGADAFKYCNSLGYIIYTGTEEQFKGLGVEISDSVKKYFNVYEDYCFENNVLYNKNKTMLIVYGAEEKMFTVPDTVKSIEEKAFYYKCPEIVILPAGIKNIGSGAFASHYTVSRHITAVFYKGSQDEWNNIIIADNNSTLTSADKYFESQPVVENDSVYTADKKKFVLYAGNEESFIIPDSVTSIGSYAFYNCDSLTNITIPDSVTIIGDYTFYGCDLLATVTLGKSVESIGSSCFENCVALSSINFPESLTSIGTSAFKGCKALTYISLPDNIGYLGSDVFMDCTSLDTICLPEGKLLSIPQNAFSGCVKLTQIYIPANITAFGDSAFYGCNQLLDIYFGGTQEAWNKIEIISSNAVIWAADVYFSHTHTTERWKEIIPAEKYKDGLEASICTVCMYEERRAISCGHEHNYVMKIITEADCITRGLAVYTCECADSYTSVIPPYNHTPVVIKGKAATCTASGLTDGKKCSVCNVTLVAQQTIPAKGHTDAVVKGKAATCTATGLTDGKKCSVCNVTLTAQQTIPAKGHTAGAWVVVTPAKVGVKGLEQQKCTVCNTVLNQRDIAALPEEEKKPEITYIKGDSNGDGKITAADARIALRISAKLEKIESYNIPVAALDVNGDGKLTAADARKILRISAKLEK